MGCKNESFGKCNSFMDIPWYIPVSNRQLDGTDRGNFNPGRTYQAEFDIRSLLDRV
jgi:hypothetical protein